MVKYSGVKCSLSGRRHGTEANRPGQKKLGRGHGREERLAMVVYLRGGRGGKERRESLVCCWCEAIAELGGRIG
jgi:hypothetical protein